MSDPSVQPPPPVTVPPVRPASPRRRTTVEEEPEVDYLGNTDLNGDCFISGELGEIEEEQLHRVYMFREVTPCASRPFERVPFTARQAEEFINDNFCAVKDIAANYTDEEAARIAWIRFCAVREGLVSPRFDPKDYFVKYSECAVLSKDANLGDWLRDNPKDRSKSRIHQRFRAVMPEPVRTQLRVWFSDMVCMVAYMFRVRGHHWLADMNDKYQDLWRKCLKAGDNPGIKWELVAHSALHAIYPLNLDGYWKRQMDASNIAGTLVKRYDSAPAGVAGIKALDAGMNDLALSVPGIKVHFKELYDEKDRLIQHLRDNRWAGSINRRFYGAGDLGFDESRFGALASTILAALTQYAPGSPLRQSQALKRMANTAPISGNFIAQMIASAAKDPNNARVLVGAGVVEKGVA